MHNQQFSRTEIPKHYCTFSAVWANISNHWPAPDSKSLMAFNGPVGSHQVRLHLPYPLKLAWNPAQQVRRISVHRKVAESMDRVLNTVLNLYGTDGIKQLGLDQWGGCLNVRKKRGGNTWSVHAWGAANNWLPQGNELNTPWKKAKFSDPAYIDFFNAWIYEGWHPLGLSWNRDAMHIEATRNEVQPLRTASLLRRYVA